MKRAVQTIDATSRHYFPQLWLLVASFVVFGLYAAWDRDLLVMVYRYDRSRIALLISALVVIASAHAIWHLLRYSRLIAAVCELLETRDTTRDDLPDPIVALLRDVADRRRGLIDEAVLDRHVDRLRSPVELGWFLVDLAVRLGLAGTIIGFILIFTSLSDTSIDGADGLRSLLLTMSGGMGTALFTTLTGLVGGALLSFQYLILGRAAETLVGLIARVPALVGEPA